MEFECDQCKDKWVEESLISISNKIADATEMAQRSKEMAAGSEAILLKAQTELQALTALLDKTYRQKLSN